MFFVSPRMISRAPVWMLSLIALTGKQPAIRKSERKNVAWTNVVLFIKYTPSVDTRVPNRA
jgi:hypothetical protein